MSVQQARQHEQRSRSRVSSAEKPIDVRLDSGGRESDRTARRVIVVAALVKCVKTDPDERLAAWDPDRGGVAPASTWTAIRIDREPPAVVQTHLSPHKRKVRLDLRELRQRVDPIASKGAPSALRRPDRIGGRVPCPPFSVASVPDTLSTSDSRARVAGSHSADTSQPRSGPPGPRVDSRAPYQARLRPRPPARGGLVARRTIGTTSLADRCRGEPRRACTIGHRRNPLSRFGVTTLCLVTRWGEGEVPSLPGAPKTRGGIKTCTARARGLRTRDERNGQRARGRTRHRTHTANPHQPQACDAITQVRQPSADTADGEDCAQVTDASGRTKITANAIERASRAILDGLNPALDNPALGTTAPVA